LKEKLKGKLLITRQVKYEGIDRPVGVPRFELGALRIQKLLNEGILELPSSLNISEEDLNMETKELMDIANHFIQVRGKWVSIVSEGEISCLALSDLLTKDGIKNLVAVDERTTRMLCENPQSLERLMSKKLHQRVTLISNDLEMFSKYKIIRSSELIFVAYKKNLVNLEGSKAMEALLYATKFAGSSISFEEINILKKL
jgi:hypothetical protein